jgi:hypothetical protein
LVHLVGEIAENLRRGDAHQATGKQEQSPPRSCRVILELLSPEASKKESVARASGIHYKVLTINQPEA